MWNKIKQFFIDIKEWFLSKWEGLKNFKFHNPLPVYVIPREQIFCSKREQAKLDKLFSEATPEERQRYINSNVNVFNVSDFLKKENLRKLNESITIEEREKYVRLGILKNVHDEIGQCEETEITIRRLEEKYGMVKK